MEKKRHASRKLVAPVLAVAWLKIANRQASLKALASFPLATAWDTVEGEHLLKLRNATAALLCFT
eukprot:1153933-Pelagomonas_calceolata.AAC.4